MKRKIITTADGSKTIHIEDWNEQYHSIHGAYQEAMHVFIKHGLNYVISHVNLSKSLSIMEMGFGTGLNAILTLIEGKKKGIKIDYVGLEAYPISDEELNELQYDKLFKSNSIEYLKMHKSEWEVKTLISPNFNITKKLKYFQNISDINAYNLIYFDAFGARIQPDLWEEDIFYKMYKALLPKGILVTYSAKGSVRRAMQAVGFKVERLPGPPGKREMLRATKNLV